MNYIYLFIKGLAMGAANVIPGVSGGTIALITGIFEELIDSIKSFDATAVKLFFTGKFKEFAKHINLWFLMAVMSGVAISILSFAKLFDYLFEAFPVYIWSFFFGLILSSVYFVGKTIVKWNFSVILIFLFGAALAITISVMIPASANDSFFYFFICGYVASCSLILPVLSGSFVLILMGNYQLVMIDAVNDRNIMTLLPVVLGAGGGLILFSHFLAWVFKKFHDHTIAILTGFILGSLGILWPWKNQLFKMDGNGAFLLKKSGEKIVEGYDWFLPDSFSLEVVMAIGFIVLGIISIWILEKVAQKKS